MNSRLLEIKVDTRELEAQLTEMQRRSLNLRPFMNAVGVIMLKSVHENFEQQGRPKWKGWAPLTQEIYDQEAYDAAVKVRKTKAGQDRQYQRNLNKLAEQKILQRTGELKKSVVMGLVTNNSVEVGSSLVYARIHQLGGDIVPVKAKALRIPVGNTHFIRLQKVTVPARPFLELQKTDIATIVKVAEDYLTRGEIG